jgi:hypothetical protein
MGQPPALSILLKRRARRIIANNGKSITLEDKSLAALDFQKSEIYQNV